MQYQSPRYEGDIAKAYEQLVGSRIDVRVSLSPETLKEAYVHFFGDLQRRTEVSLVSLMSGGATSQRLGESTLLII